MASVDPLLIILRFTYFLVSIYTPYFGAYLIDVFLDVLNIVIGRHR